MAKLADAPDLGSGAARRGGSSPSTRTNPVRSAEITGYRAAGLGFALGRWAVNGSGWTGAGGVDTTGKVALPVTDRFKRSICISSLPEKS